MGILGGGVITNVKRPPPPLDHPIIRSNRQSAYLNFMYVSMYLYAAEQCFCFSKNYILLHTAITLQAWGGAYHL